MFNEVEAVKTYLSGNKIPDRAIDDCVYQIAKYYKDQGKEKFEVRKIIIDWRDKNKLNFFDINNNIDNAYETKSKLRGDFNVFINQDDINAINNSVDFNTVKKIALFLTVYAKIHAGDDGWFKIRVATIAEWGNTPRGKLNERINQLNDYRFLEITDRGGYEKYLKSKHGDKRMAMRICHNLKNKGEYNINRNEDFEKLFSRIFD